MPDHDEVEENTAQEVPSAPVETPNDDGASGDSEAGLVESVGGKLTWIPYAADLAAWLVLAGASAYLFKDATPDSPARWLPTYAIILWTGVGLTVLGPVLSLCVWLVARTRRLKADRRGLFVSALVRGALTTAFGFAIWLATIYVMELVATGVIS